MVPVSSWHTVPAGIPGPRITQGTRWPPSKVVPLPSRRGPAEPQLEVVQRLEQAADLGINVLDGIDIGVLGIRVADFIWNIERNVRH